MEGLAHPAGNYSRFSDCQRCLGGRCGNQGRWHDFGGKEAFAIFLHPSGRCKSSQIYQIAFAKTLFSMIECKGNPNFLPLTTQGSQTGLRHYRRANGGFP
jgi:hypothetical protein